MRAQVLADFTQAAKIDDAADTAAGRGLGEAAGHRAIGVGVGAARREHRVHQVERRLAAGEVGRQFGGVGEIRLHDLDARIRNLKASEAALVGYAQNAPKVSDLLEIEARLTDTRGQIERLTAQQAQLSDQAAFATLTVTFGTDVVAVIQTAQRWDPAAEVDRATATLIGMGQAVVSFLIVFAIVWVPLILVISIIGLIALLVARRLGWRRSGPYPPLAPPPPPSSVEA